MQIISLTQLNFKQERANNSYTSFTVPAVQKMIFRDFRKISGISGKFPENFRNSRKFMHENFEFPGIVRLQLKSYSKRMKTGSPGNSRKFPEIQKNQEIQKEKQEFPGTVRLLLKSY